MEERLRKLELALGANNTTSTTTTEDNNASIMERLQQAERLTNETNPKQLDKLAAKAKVIRADLEAAARARTKLVLLSVEEALEKIEGGWKSNMEGVEKNLERYERYVPRGFDRMLGGSEKDEIAQAQKITTTTATEYIIQQSTSLRMHPLHTSMM